MANLLLKNAVEESRLFRDRALIAWVIILCLSLVLLYRLFELQINQQQHYELLSRGNWLKRIPIAPTRGLIFDRNGKLLAENRPTYTLEIVPEKVKDMPDLIQRLRQFVSISDSDIKRFERYRKQKRRFDRVPLRFKLSKEEVARVAVRNHEFEGVYINDTLTRYYKQGTVAAHAIGYVGRMNETELKNLKSPGNYRATHYIGKIGVEKTYEKELHGKIGWQEVETNVRGRMLRVLNRSAPTPGKNLILSLDLTLQKFVEKQLQNKRSALVAIEPSTGNILALTSMPSYDPNKFVHGIKVKDYHELLYSPDRPLFNRAIRGQYPPGSTIKAMVGLAGLEHGLRKPSDTTYCRGWYQLKGHKHRYRDWKKSGHGTVNFLKSVEQSCDVYFYRLAQELGIDNLSHFLQQFGFGHRTGIDIPGEAAGLMPDRAWKRKRYNKPWYPGETLIAGIGQGYTLATPLQLAVAVAALGMKGKIYKPRLAFSWLANRNYLGASQVINTPVPPPIQLKSPTYWDNAIQAMVAVIHGKRGTARKRAKGLRYTMAGKTGTAQVVGIKQDAKYDAGKLNKRHWDHALFVAFAPIEDPRIAVAVIVENGGSGSRTAAPIARDVIDFYLTQVLPVNERIAPPAPKDKTAIISPET